MNDEMYTMAKEAIKNNYCFFDNEVLAEVVFVLMKVYNTSKSDIKNTLVKFLSFENIILNSKPTILKALELFGKKNIDFAKKQKEKG